MACMWIKHACSGGTGKKPPADVPRGHLAVTVGEANRRFVIRADYLNHPLLQQLLDKAYEEGHDDGFNKSGPLAIPCDELLFKDIIRSLRDGADSRRPSFSSSSSPSSSFCHVPLKKLDLSLGKETVSLLQGFDGKRSGSS